MAHVALDTDRVRVELNPLDEVLSLHGSLHLPYSHIRSITCDPVPPAWSRGFRIGTNMPGVKVAGTFFTGDGVVFYDFHDPARCLTFELAHERYRNVVVQVDKDQEPEELVSKIAARLHA